MLDPKEQERIREKYADRGGEGILVEQAATERANALRLGQDDAVARTGTIMAGLGYEPADVRAEAARDRKAAAEKRAAAEDKDKAEARAEAKDKGDDKGDAAPAADARKQPPAGRTSPADRHQTSRPATDHKHKG